MTSGRGLSAMEGASLRRDGYLLVPSLLDQMVLARIRRRLDEPVRQAIAAWQADPVQDTVEPGVVRVRLDLADADFAACHEHPLLADAATTVLGTGWHLAALNLRAPLPGCGHQGLHPDYEQRRTGEPWQTLSAMWAITAFTAENGPLRVIPSSHRVSEPPIDMQAFGSGMGPHSEEVKITAPAGSVILFNSADLWHSGTFNYSPEPRLAVTAGFAPGSC
ncbi:MAG: phytanoyl-CoA dioxygenase family protein [Streptosporangiaceae bacterium]